ncbi:hypothetical protein F66182_8751 [Fusarium sp. NRRL 66182]|nr:hypothetical protein F66182_8751 [Fusarium sp. NRRL 66182]
MSKDDKQPPNPTESNKKPTDSKGKARDTGVEDSDSIINRLQASGRQALNAFGTGPDLSGQSPGGKATSEASSIGRVSSSTGEALSHRLRSAAQSGSLRSQKDVDSGASAQAFNDFVSADTTLEAEGLGQYGYRQSQSYDLPDSRSSAVSEQEKLDGAAVVSLLDGPSDELDAVLVGAEEPDAENQGLTPEAAARLREALFPANLSSSYVRWDSLLNFNPDFLSQPGAEAEFERQLHLGTTDTDEARIAWVQQWGNVLTGYTDHVWGDLEPLIAEARREVDELKAQRSEAAPETKALGRLRQILAHVRGF